MPSRHIPPESFDAILSDLGNDPAIPDPHGIRRKTQLPPNPQPSNQKQSIHSIRELGPFLLNPSLQKLGLLLTIGVSLVALCFSIYVHSESLSSSSEAQIQDSQRGISELHKELTLLRKDLELELDELYESIDLLEVSIHSLEKNKGYSKANSKENAISHETELSRWRLLGTAQISGSHQAFFYTGKKNVAFEKGDRVLGDWRLSQLEERLATLTHPSGKMLVIQPSKSE